jgi:ABC-type spermidine/putrescine transport system permease subunit I
MTNDATTARVLGGLIDSRLLLRHANGQPFENSLTPTFSNFYLFFCFVFVFCSFVLLFLFVALGRAWNRVVASARALRATRKHKRPLQHV